MTDPQPTNAHLMDAIRDLAREVQNVSLRTTTIETARAAARSEYDENWADVKGRLDDSRIRLERIEFQTTRTNGRLTVVEAAVGTLSGLVAELREWKAYMSGVAASFSWWKTAVATIVAAGVLWILTR